MDMSRDRPTSQPTANIAGAGEKLQLLTAALEVAANPIMISTRDGTIILVNKAFEQLSGYTRDEAIGQNTGLFKSGRQSPEFYKIMWETILAGHKWRGELVNRRKDGSLYPEEMTITPVANASGDITHFIASKLNCGERTLANGRQAASENTGAMERFLNELVFNINNIVAVIKGYTELASEGILSDDPRSKHLEEIKKACRRVDLLTREEFVLKRNTWRPR